MFSTFQKEAGVFDSHIVFALPSLKLCMNKRYPAVEMKGKMDLFDSRAPPRRRVKGEDADDQPIFLRKAYTMMNTCPPEIGGWSEEGDAIVVKDMKLFAQSVIPTAYRHNNFASFVRQLNFYGFRKVKSDSLERAHWWIFRHPYFLRGQPHLISEIKRSVHFANEQAGSKEVGELKNQVSSLSDRLAALTDQVDRLTLAVNGGPLSIKEGSKKRKTSSTTSPYTAAAYTPVEAVAVKQEGVVRMSSLSNFDFDYFMELEQKGSNNNNHNDMSIVMIEEEDCDADFDLDMSSPRQQTQQADHSQAIAAVKELSNILSSLTPELKERFVDKLAEVMGTQLANNMAVKVEQQRSATPVAFAAASPEQVMPYVKMEPSMTAQEEEMKMEMEEHHNDENTYYPELQKEYMLPSGSKAPPIALPLASATLGAFLSSLHALKYNVPPTPSSFAEAIATFA